MAGELMIHSMLFLFIHSVVSLCDPMDSARQASLSLIIITLNNIMHNSTRLYGASCCADSFTFKKIIYLFWLPWVLVRPVGSSSRTRDQTLAPSIGSVEF